MNLLIKFHEDRTINDKCPALGSHVFQANVTIFELIQDIIETNLLTKVHEHWTINVASRVLTRLSFFNRLFTCFHYIHIEKTAPSPGGHVFTPIMTIFELVRDIYKIDAKNVTSRKTHVLTKIHEDWTKNATSRVFTCFHYKHIEKTAPPPGGHVFSPIWTIFKLVQDINETNVLTKFHDDLTKIVTSRVFTRNTAPPPGGHVFQRTGTMFELNQHII
ncbi:hypothetical protein DPMN_040398 [Dreissena polymorpha]|uniref:Uncharacterized protein n=1 Tax=Dreissena polymorpha TaxID=45954 RepID=A0A9D4HV60_DREPO|nr:hypothetical protein DPMN_040398 [Dreissena polymorpha]